MDRFSNSNNLYGGQTKEDTIKDTTKDIFKKEETDKKTEPKVTNSYILSNDLTRVLKKNRELYNYIEILESDKQKLEKRVKELEKQLNK
ncbi:MAG: hypothetical protein CMH79_05165 [Nitrospinae bacterium]|nr:hypothetical protein [Nitrospinota bacterium]